MYNSSFITFIFSCFDDGPHCLFQVEVTKYEELEEVHAELKLKELLWSSLTEWDEILAEWQELPFNTLDPEEMNAQVYYLLL